MNYTVVATAVSLVVGGIMFAYEYFSANSARTTNRAHRQNPNVSPNTSNAINDYRYCKECCICQEECVRGGQNIRLACQHWLHQSCFIRYLLRPERSENVKCPLCKTIIRTDIVMSNS